MNEIQELKQLVVTRDGSIDAEYYAETDAQARREALHELGKRTLHIALRTPVVIAKSLSWLALHEVQNV